MNQKRRIFVLLFTAMGWIAACSIRPDSLESGNPAEEHGSEEISAENGDSGAESGQEQSEESSSGEESAGSHPLEESAAASRPEEESRHSHSWKTEETEPTCTAAGSSVRFCSCGVREVLSARPPLGHAFGPWQDAGEDPEGWEERSCRNCGERETRRKEEKPPEPAGQGDERAIAGQIIEFINEYRDTPAQPLPGLTRVAEYRSTQLISDFSHSEEALEEAWTACQYGEYTETEITRWDEETQTVIHTGEIWKGYLFNGGMEAIGQVSGLQGSIKALAEELATGCRESPEHWAYVGSSAYPYIAVGVSWGGEDRWYCCIYVSMTDQYG